MESLRGVRLSLLSPCCFAALSPAQGRGSPQLTTQVGVPTAVPLLLQGHAALLQLLADINGHLRPHVPALHIGEAGQGQEGGVPQHPRPNWGCRRPWFNSRVGKIRWRRDRLPTPLFLGFSCGSLVKNLPAVLETWVQSLDWVLCGSTSIHKPFKGGILRPQRAKCGKVRNPLHA